MPRRKKPRFTHAYGQRVTGPGLRRNPSFMGLMIVIFMFVLVMFGRDRLFSGVPDLSGEFAVHFIDIGQGDAVLIQNSDGEFMLIDTGGSQQWPKLSSYLEHFGVGRFRYVVFTHPHADHIGSAHRIVREFDIDTLIMPPAVNDTVEFNNLLDALEERALPPTRAVAGDFYEFGDASFLIIAPLSEGYANLNDYSVVILMNHGENRFLFTGDMERRSENEIIRHSLDNNLDISADVLQVAHHGSATSSQADFLALIRPQLAVIQVGEDNPFNHPTMAVIGRLEDVGAEILRNDWHGDIIVRSDGRGLTVHTSRGNYDGRFAGDN